MQLHLQIRTNFTNIMLSKRADTWRCTHYINSDKIQNNVKPSVLLEMVPLVRSVPGRRQVESFWVCLIWRLFLQLCSLYEYLSIYSLCAFWMFIFSKNPVFSFWLWLTACGILVPLPGIKLQALSSEMLSSNHWTAREFPNHILLLFFFQTTF